VKGLYSGFAARQKRALSPYWHRKLMSRLVLLIFFILLLVGGLIFLSTAAEEQPTRTIEVDVPQAGNAS